MKKHNLSGLNTTTYLTRSLLNKIFGKKLSSDEIDEYILSGKLNKKFSYYQASETLLRELGLIPNSVKIAEHLFGKLAKHNAFVLFEIAEIFGNCNKDTVKLIANRYFYKKYNYYYKNDLMVEYLIEGKEVYEI